MTKECGICNLLQSQWDSDEDAMCSSCEHERRELLRIRELYAGHPKLALMQYRSKLWADMAEQLYTYGEPAHPGTGLWSLTESEIREMQKLTNGMEDE